MFNDKATKKLYEDLHSSVPLDATEDELEEIMENEMRFMPKLVPDPYNPKAPKIWVAWLECQGFWIGSCKDDLAAMNLCDYLNERDLGGMVHLDEEELEALSDKKVEALITEDEAIEEDLRTSSFYTSEVDTIEGTEEGGIKVTFKKKNGVTTDLHCTKLTF